MSVLETVFQILINRFLFSDVLFTNDTTHIRYYHHLQKSKYVQSEHSYFIWGPRWRSWLRHCATSQKVAGLIPDGVIGFFH